jgi:peptidyl-prolyl cis-trans isomerase B (cyclophilin B)
VAGSAKRERQLARERYERQQARRAAARARRRRNQQVAGVVVAVLAVVGGIIALTTLTGSGKKTTAASSTPTPTSSSTGTTSAATVCPPPTLDQPKKPQTFAKEPPLTVDRKATYVATMQTNCGTITMDLFAKQAPHTVNSFAFLAAKGYFLGSRCHRLTTSGIYVLQCGDPTGTGTGGPGYGFGIENAPKDGAYPAGTVAMARSTDPNSNGSQFFLVYRKTSLPTTGGGYTIFGRITKGLDVVTKVARAGVSGGSTDGTPTQEIAIESMKVA